MRHLKTAHAAQALCLLLLSCAHTRQPASTVEASSISSCAQIVRSFWRLPVFNRRELTKLNPDDYEYFFPEQLLAATEGDEDLLRIPPLYDRKATPKDSLRTLAMSTQTKVDAQLLKEARIPRWARPFYNSEGAFLYKPKKPKPLASDSGYSRIKYLRITANPRVGTDIIDDLIPFLTANPHIRVWWSISKRDELETGLDEEIISRFPLSLRDRISIYTNDSFRKIPIWNQDDSKPMLKEGHTLVPSSNSKVESIENHDSLDYFGPLKQLTGARKIEMHFSPFRFEGGNILVGERHIFIGDSIFEENMALLRINEDDLIQALSLEFGKPVVRLSQMPAPNLLPLDFHIDLDIALGISPKTGEEIAFVGSPRLAQESLNKQERVHPSDIEAWSYAQNLDYPSDDYLELKARQKVLDRIAAKIRQLGYRVIRVPSLITGSWQNEDISLVSAPLNALFSENQIMMPAAKSPILTEAARKVFESEGFKVYPMKSAPQYFCDHGGIRCAIQAYRSEQN